MVVNELLIDSVTHFQRIRLPRNTFTPKLMLGIVKSFFFFPSNSIVASTSNFVVIQTKNKDSLLNVGNSQHF